jgi:hypothetical protein
MERLKSVVSRVKRNREKDKAQKDLKVKTCANKSCKNEYIIEKNHENPCRKIVKINRSFDDSYELVDCVPKENQTCPENYIDCSENLEEDKDIFNKELVEFKKKKMEIIDKLTRDLPKYVEQNNLDEMDKLAHMFLQILFHKLDLTNQDVIDFLDREDVKKIDINLKILTENVNLLYKELIALKIWDEIQKDLDNDLIDIINKKLPILIKAERKFTTMGRKRTKNKNRKGKKASNLKRKASHNGDKKKKRKNASVKRNSFKK